MANSQFITKLQRELKRNPKKTAILAIGVLVAGYFWAPLLAGWFGDDTKPKKPTTTAAATPLPEQRAVAESGSPVAPPEELDWESMLSWIQEDPHMVSSLVEQQERSPFASIPKDISADLEFAGAEPIEENESQAVAPVDLATPQSAGLELTGTIVAGNGGWAQISGTHCRPGDVIYVGEVDVNDPAALAARVGFTLEEIGATHVVLSREDKTYRLEMAVPSLSGGSRIEFIQTEVAGH